jgi:hypothetical protein
VPYDNIISRTDADVLIPTEQAEAVIKAATQESAALTLFNRAQLSTKVTRQPVMAALPVAYWVSGDTGLKQTTEAAWAGVDLVAEEIAAIVPIPEAVVDDSSFDVWGELRPASAWTTGSTGRPDRCGLPVRTSTAGPWPTLRASPSTSRAGSPCDAPEMLTKTLTTPASVVSRENEKPCYQGFSLWAVPGSNQRPPACKAGALPTELTARWAPGYPRADLDANGAGVTVLDDERRERLDRGLGPADGLDHAQVRAPLVGVDSTADVAAAISVEELDVGVGVDHRSVVRPVDDPVAVGRDRRADELGGHRRRARVPEVSLTGSRPGSDGSSSDSTLAHAIHGWRWWSAYSSVAK